ncbi:MAG: primosomal protein N' [Gammaproteobacteria bacterium]|nr:primosomal protein N' [Gammaproteobacteria bacterium]
MNTEPILRVAINVPLSRYFDYLPPTAGPSPSPGARVRVPFGRRKVVGIVMATAADSELPRNKLKRAIAVLDDETLLDEDSLWLVRFTSDYYHHPIGEVTAAALPGLLRKGGDLYPTVRFVVATDAGTNADLNELQKRAPKQAELLVALADAGGNGIDEDSLTEQLPNWRRVAKPLRDKGLIDHFEARGTTRSAARELVANAGPALNENQVAAVDAVRRANGFAAYLLDGVTGSGKTEVYLHLIKDVVEGGRQALVLVPEIGLTPQLVARFQTRLGIEPALLHSGLNDSERLGAWRRARSGDALLVVGTRSAVFTPLPNVKLIVVDEEHDHSFKQQEGLRYSARDLAIVRAKHAGVPVILGTATPTLEMLKHCLDGNYHHLRLPDRAGDAIPPLMRTVDISNEYVDNGLGSELEAAVRRHLSAGNQVMLYLNRRGFAPTLVCPGCGHVAECRQCDSRMTVHARDQRLRCHHCGDSRRLDTACESCGSDLRPLGAGTERLEEALIQLFPDANIRRIDSDSTQRRGAMHEALSAATDGEADILVGTQMLSKGHHFPKLTLVGVINADQGLFGTDFRSDERMAQSIIQVAGRAGREQIQGEVVIQTSFPSHPFWARLIDAGYAGVSGDALAERESTHWPPFSRLALIRCAARRRDDAHQFLHATKRAIADNAGDAVRVLGPVDAVMARKAGRYRVQLLVQSQDRQALHAVLRQLRPILEEAPSGRKLRWSIDVDPIELY